MIDRSTRSFGSILLIRRASTAQDLSLSPSPFLLRLLQRQCHLFLQDLHLNELTFESNRRDRLE